MYNTQQTQKTNSMPSAGFERTIPAIERPHTHAKFAPRPHYVREVTLVLIQQEAGWAAKPIWTFRRKEKSIAAAGIRIKIFQPVTYHYKVIFQQPQ
jgi:hypothetical protein